MKLYLIRHGQTDWNTDGKIQGSTDIPLNETGRIQARWLAEGMRDRPVARIFTSPLMRAADTAAAVGLAQHVEVEQVKGLVEVGFGKWEGKTWKEVQEEYKEEYRRWWLNPVDMGPPGGELQTEIRLRCRQAVDYIMSQASRTEGDVAVVAHGATLAYILEYFMRNHPLHEEIIVDNASITTVEYSPKTDDYVLLDINDTGHLCEV